MASDRSKRTYTTLWDGWASLPVPFKDMDTAFRPDGCDQHFKTNHRLALELHFMSQPFRLSCMLCCLRSSQTRLI